MAADLSARLERLERARPARMWVVNVMPGESEAAACERAGIVEPLPQSALLVLVQRFSEEFDDAAI